MKYSKNYHYITFTIVFIIFLWSKMGYTECKPAVYNDITTQLTAEGLSKILDKWNKDLTTECYYYIGKQYLSFYRKDLNVQNLSEAIKFLEYASKKLIPFGPIYEKCHQFYSEATIYSRHHHIILQMNDYLSDPTQKIQMFESEDLQLDVIKKLLKMPESGYLQLDVIKKFLKINEILKSFQTELDNLKNNQSLVQVKKIIQHIDKLELAGVETNIPEIQAIHRLEKYHEIYRNSYNQKLDRRCTQLGVALSSLRAARTTFDYLEDNSQVECHRGFICLSRDIQRDINNLMPGHNHRNDFSNRLRRCQNYLSQYRDRIAQCKNVIIAGDQQPKLNDIISFYEAYNCLSSPPQGVSPTSRLEQYFSGIQNNNNDYAVTLHSLTGFYIANYYYQQSFSLLSQGTGENRNQTLRKISYFNTKYHLYRRFVHLRGGVDVIQHYQFLVDFFNQYHSNPNGTSTFLSQMNHEIKNAWGLTQLVRARLSEIQREEEQQNFQQPDSQKEDQPQQQETIQEMQSSTVEINTDTNERIPGIERRDQYQRQAQKAFNKTDYFEAWQLYGNAYPEIIPERLSELYQNIGVFQNAGTGQIWTAIDRNHRQRIEILCLIMNMENQYNVRNYINNILNLRKGYSNPEIVWHISEPSHGNDEKKSDSQFLSGLYYFLSGDSTNIQIINWFLGAYHQLDRPLEFYTDVDLSRVRNKRDRILFWLKKAWSNYDALVKRQIWVENHNEHPRIFGLILQLPDEDQVAAKSQRYQQTMEEDNHQDIPPPHVYGVSNNQHIATFETFARAMLQLTEPISCEFIRQFYPENRYTNINDCLRIIISKTRSRIRSQEDRYSYYYALALIRKAQKDLLNWIENIAIAYSNIPNDGNRVLRQIKLKKELAEAKLQTIHNSQINIPDKIRRYLEHAKLLRDWNNRTFIKTYLNCYDDPEYVRADLNSLSCIDSERDLVNKRNFLKKLLNTFLADTDPERRSEYALIFINFVNNEKCISRKERAIWLRRWYAN